jgi:RNA polymerase sigma-70 factor (ECF subfamily)
MEYPTDDITDLQLAAAAQHSTTELPSVEDQALKAFSDNDVKAAMQALPEQFRFSTDG